MKRKFSIIEKVRTVYEIETTPTFDAALETTYLSFQDWLTAVDKAILWDETTTNFIELVDILETYDDTIVDEDTQC